VVVSLVVVPQALTRLSNVRLNTPIAERLTNFIFFSLEVSSLERFRAPLVRTRLTVASPVHKLTAKQH